MLTGTCSLALNSDVKMLTVEGQPRLWSPATLLP